MVRLVYMYCLQNGSIDQCPRADQCDADRQKCDRVGMWRECNATCEQRDGFEIWERTNHADKTDCSTMLPVPCRKNPNECPPAKAIRYEEDPRIKRLNMALIGLAIAAMVVLLIDVVCVVFVCNLKKRKALEQEKGEWTVAKPPEVTTTPADDLVKGYAKKGTPAWSVVTPPEVTTKPTETLLKDYTGKKSERKGGDKKGAPVPKNAQSKDSPGKKKN